MTQREVEKYSKATRVLHWVHTGSFLLLFLTGLVLFIPQLGFLAQDSWTRVIHRVAASIFIIIPIVFLVFRPAWSWRGIRDAFAWSAEDKGWLKAAPAYYFIGDESAMPPQGAMNTGQKLWWLIVLVSGVFFIISGAVMWFFKTAAPPALLQWMVILHDVFFILTGAMLFVHIYLGVIHPMMTESRGAIIHGKISVEYARKHHAKWYEEVTKSKAE